MAIRKNMLSEPLTWIELSKSALEHNLQQIRRLIGNHAKIFPCVKSNAYGHGLEEIGTLLKEINVEGFSVADLTEARQLLELRITKPIQIMSPLPAMEAPRLTGVNVWVWIHDLESAKNIEKEVERSGARLKVVMKVDTGMGRLGVGIEDYVELLQFIVNSEHLELMSVATHFATADKQDELFRQQCDLFEAVKKKVHSIVGDSPVLFQAANSAAILGEPRTHGDIVRPGLAIYGYWPTEQTAKMAAGSGIVLKQVLQWKAILVQVKNLAEGANVGYGGIFEAAQNMKLGVVPVGYAHGLDYRLGNKGSLVLGGKLAPIVGNICMNLTMVDVTEVEGVKAGDEVEIVSSAQSAIELTQKGELFLYEMLTRLSSEIIRQKTEE